MTGLYGALQLGCADGGATVATSAHHIEQALGAQPTEYLCKRLIDQTACHIGVALPSVSNLVFRSVLHAESRRQLLYFGDGRMGEGQLMEVAQTGKFEALHGFFVVVSIEFKLFQGANVVEKCSLVRDRSGSLPLVYRFEDNCLLFAPRIAALHTAAPELADINHAGLGFLMSSGYIPGEHTQFTAIKKVLPGTTTVVEIDKTPRCERYWRIPPCSVTRQLNSEQLVHLATEYLYEAVRVNYTDPERTAVFLSGGVDSRAIALSCVKLCDDPRSISTISWGENDQVSGSDAQIAAVLAKRMGTTHHFFTKDLSNYGADFDTACRLTDWLCDTPWHQPQEWSLMRDLRDLGFRQCLRGDQVISQNRSAMTKDYAHSLAELKCLRRQRLAGELLRPEVHRAWSRLTDQCLENLATPEGYTPTDLRDLYEFEEQQANEHQSEALYKMVFLDHRSPFLDDLFLKILPYAQRRDRSNRRIIYQMLQHIAGNTADVPFAHVHSDLDKTQYFALSGVARGCLLRAVEDADSPVFQFFDRTALQNLIFSKATSTPVRKRGNRLLKKSKNLAIAGASIVAPLRTAQAAYRHRSAALPSYNALGRFLVIKHFVDQHFR